MARTKTCTSCGRTLPRSRRYFHSKGVSPWTGRRYYSSECIDCRNRRLAGKRQRTPRGAANKRQYNRVRSRALRRLAKEYPERYWELFEEELIRDARQPRPGTTIRSAREAA